MIHANSYLNAATVANRLREQGVAATAKDNTVLSELLDLSVSVVTAKTTDLKTITTNGSLSNTAHVLPADQRADAVRYVTGDQDEPSLHSLKIAALAEDLAPLVASHISHARNTVVPLVAELSNKLSKFKEVARPIDPSTMFLIEQRDLPAIVLDESFMADGLNAYENLDIGYEHFSLTPEAPEDPLYYKSLTNLGNDRLNALVEEWLSTKEPDFIKSVFVENFGVRTFPASGVPNPGEHFAKYGIVAHHNPYDTLDIALACYLISSRLMVEILPLKGVSLEKYKTVMRKMVDFSASTVMKSIRAIKRHISTNVLVAEAVISQKRLVVNRTLYKSWLQSGGRPELLLGMLASGKILYAINAIEEQKEVLERQWNNFVMFSRSDVSAEFNRRFVTYCESEVLQGLNDLTESEAEYARDYPGFKEYVHKLVKDEIEHLGHRIMDDVDHTALHLIAKCRFYYTSAYTILSEMAEVAKANPDIDPREAALLSVINYVAEYFENQLVVVK